jgi:hypothetical protein
MRRLLILLFLAAGAATATGAAPETACTLCHGNADTFDDEGVRRVRDFLGGVHAEVGLSCEDCHGGNPDPALSEDMELAMDPGFAPNPYRGVPERPAIPGLCGRCHSDPAFMRRYKPDPRVDQEQEYRTSHHGQKLAEGDANVATCIDCHGIHGILRIDNPEAPVYPTRVADTCGGCHRDPDRMKGYTRADGSPLPVDQFDRWRRSVHAAALLEKEDLSAPTCNDCHGNHGAAPPGLESVAFVCGQCHGREAALFRASPKRNGFQEHNEYLVDSGGDCRSCHSDPEPQAEVRIHQFTECATCHDNHAVIRPTVALLGSLPETPCAFCHESAGPVLAVEEPEKIFRHYVAERDVLLARADSLGLDANRKFDWMVDQALELPFHTLALPDDEGGAALRPQFARLFDKFRIGKTSYTYFDPARGEEVRAEVIHCSVCHAADDVASGEAVGMRTSLDFLGRMRELTSLTAQAERTMLSAQRGGVEVRDGLLELDKAVDSQIELEVLVHTFAAGDSSAFSTKHREGMDHAGAAILAGRDGLRELSQRRRGLFAALTFIALTLVGLGLKIRRMS